MSSKRKAPPPPLNLDSSNPPAEKPSSSKLKAHASSTISNSSDSLASASSPSTPMYYALMYYSFVGSEPATSKPDLKLTGNIKAIFSTFKAAAIRLELKKREKKKQGWAVADYTKWQLRHNDKVGGDPTPGFIGCTVMESTKKRPMYTRLWWIEGGPFLGEDMLA